MKTTFDPFDIEPIRVLEKMDPRLVNQMRSEVDNFQCFVMSELFNRVNRIMSSAQDCSHPFVNRSMGGVKRQARSRRRR